MEQERERCHRPYVFDKMEGLVHEMMDADHGVPVRSQKLFLTSIPSAFMGYDLIEWLMERLAIEESEALNLANQLCQYGYFFPISDSKNLVVKDDSSLYRFQATMYWPYHRKPPGNVEYAIYLLKRTLRNKQRHALDDYEAETLGNLRRNLANKWDFIMVQAEEQARLTKAQKKGDKVVSDSQERAYWRVHRPPPGATYALEQWPVPIRRERCREGARRSIEELKREIEHLKNSLTRTRIKVSQALESMVQHVETYMEYDAMIAGSQPSNPWVSEDLAFWQLNSPLVELPTEKRVRRWALSMEELVSDPTGLQEFTNYLRKEYSHENIRFWTAVNDLRRAAQSQIQRIVQEIYQEFLAPGAPCEINIDGKTMEKVQQEMKHPSRFTFDAAQEHVYTLLLKKDCYPRFIRSDHYKNLLAAGIQPSQKKRFFGFGPPKKKASTSNAPNSTLPQQQTPQQGIVIMCGALSKRRGSDRSLSGSAHELAVSGVRDSRVPHSHSQSNLSDIPYRGDLAGQSKATGSSTCTPAEITEEPHTSSDYSKKPSIAIVPGTSTSEDVCPWDIEPRSRKNSAQFDSGSSSSEISVAIAEVTERLKKNYTLTQQNTMDGGQSSTKLSAASCSEPRRASVSVPMSLPEVVASGSGDADKTFKKSHSLTKACSVASANAPIISVSSVADVEDSSEDDDDDVGKEAAAPPPVVVPMAPLAEPDSESPASEMPPELEEAKSNDVCPWEDEEACKVDAPFVKTYSTLGYL